jgi:hypothetical protein
MAGPLGTLRGVLVAVDVLATANGILATIGVAAGTFAVIQGIASKRRADRAERQAITQRERAVDREDFDSVVNGLRGLIAERTTQYNDLLAGCKAEREEHLARIHQLGGSR